MQVPTSLVLSPFWLHPGDTEAPQCVLAGEAEMETPSRGGGPAPCPPPREARRLLYLGLGWQGRRGAWVPGLRGLGGGGRGLWGGQSPVPAWPGGAAAPGAGRDHRERGRMRDAGCGMQAPWPIAAREDGLVPWQQPMAAPGRGPAAATGRRASGRVQGLRVQRKGGEPPPREGGASRSRTLCPPPVPE